MATWNLAVYIFLLLSTTAGGRLPTATDAGARSVVTGILLVTLSAIVAGGGANVVPVFWDGTQWRNG